jgi:hypothetical protein
MDGEATFIGSFEEEIKARQRCWKAHPCEALEEGIEKRGTERAKAMAADPKDACSIYASPNVSTPAQTG